MQLVAYGAQDIYLTGNPQITFFKVVYRRHTNFSMESIEQTINGSVSGGCVVTVSRNGDLVGRMYVEHDPGGSVAENNYGYHILQEVEVEIGGQRIDRHYNHWLNTWAELTEPNSTGNATANHADMGTGITQNSNEWLAPVEFLMSGRPRYFVYPSSILVLSQPRSGASP